MAVRKIFVPETRSDTYVKTYEVQFNWNVGNSLENIQSMVQRMHMAASYEHGLKNLCEISGASVSPTERSLSAFQLPIKIKNKVTTVECAYQGSKVFERGGPYQDLYNVGSRQAKKDPRLFNSGKLVSFQLGDIEYSTEPKTAFYDWLYVGALCKWVEEMEISNMRFIKYLNQSDGFTDIYFNPNRSINCQARSVALFVSLYKRNLIDLKIDFQDYDLFKGGF